MVDKFTKYLNYEIAIKQTYYTHFSTQNPQPRTLSLAFPPRFSHNFQHFCTTSIKLQIPGNFPSHFSHAQSDMKCIHSQQIIACKL